MSTIIVILGVLAVFLALYVVHRRYGSRLGRLWTGLLTPPSTVPVRPTLEEAVANTLWLVAYASETGTKLADTEIAAVIVAKRALTSLTPDQEKAFWMAAASISKAVAPVTVDSLTYSTACQPNGRSRAQKSALTYRVATLLTLFVLLAFQIYWTVGAAITGELKEARTQLEALRAEVRAGRAAKPVDSKAANYSAELKKWQDGLDEWNSRLDAQQIIALTNFNLLQKWNQPLRRWQPPPKSKPTASPDTSKDALQNGAPAHFLWVFSPKNVAALGNAEIKLTAMLKYILPMLYGLLGACAFIMRTIANEIKDKTFSLGSSVRYQLRFFLGAVAGLSIAWFTSDTKSQESTGILQSFSPLALAFLAGYSVDLLFSLLDRLVVAFSGPEPKTSS